MLPKGTLNRIRQRLIPRESRETMADTTTVKLGNREFVLDKSKAEEAYSSKKVINGKDSRFFNILPLQYQWA